MNLFMCTVTAFVAGFVVGYLVAAIVARVDQEGESNEFHSYSE